MCSLFHEYHKKLFVSRKKALTTEIIKANCWIWLNDRLDLCVLLASDSPVGDIGAYHDAIPRDLFRLLVGIALSFCDVIAQCGGTKYAATVGGDISVDDFGAGVKYLSNLWITIA